MKRQYYRFLLFLMCLHVGIFANGNNCIDWLNNNCTPVRIKTNCQACITSCVKCTQLTCKPPQGGIKVNSCSFNDNTTTFIAEATYQSLKSNRCSGLRFIDITTTGNNNCTMCNVINIIKQTISDCNICKIQCDINDSNCLCQQQTTSNNASTVTGLLPENTTKSITLLTTISALYSPTTPTISINETYQSNKTSSKSNSLSGLAIGLIVAAVLIVAIIITLLVIWKLRYNCRVPAFLSRNDTIRSSTTALTSIEKPKEQDGTVYEKIAEHPYNELEPSEENGLGYTEISCGPDSNVHSNTDQSDTYSSNGRSGQTYSHLHEHSRELTHDYNMSQGTELSNSGSGVNHAINRNGSTPNYTLATVINENKEHTDVGSYNKGRLDNEVSLPNITEEDNLESDYDVPPVRKDQEKNPYFELENEPVKVQVIDDNLDTEYDVPPARKADPNMYFELQNLTETDQSTEDNIERHYNDLNDASINPYFQLENDPENHVNRMDDYSDKSSSDGDHHSIGDTEPDGDGSLIGDYDVPPPRRENP